MVDEQDSDYVMGLDNPSEQIANRERLGFKDI